MLLLVDQIKQEAIASLKAGDSKKANALRYLLSLVAKKEMTLPAGKTLSDVEVVGVLQKELKNKQESVEIYKQAQRPELVAEIEQEINWLNKYLPKALTEEELVEIIEKVKLSGAIGFGPVMGQVSKQVAGRMDGAKVAEMVKKVCNL